MKPIGPIGEDIVIAREIMRVDGVHVDASASIVEVARVMRDERLASLPVCRAGRMIGEVTQSDIVTRCVAGGLDPSALQAAELTRSTMAVIGVEDSVETALITMATHRVRRLPVVDGDLLVGEVTQVDVTSSLAAS